MATAPTRRGKVRDIYELGDQLLLVASDRISAFDWVLPNDIPDKGRVLTQISGFWFSRLNVPNHLISQDSPLVWPVLQRFTLMSYLLKFSASPKLFGSFGSV